MLSIAKKTFLKSVMQEGINTSIFYFFLTASATSCMMYATLLEKIDMFITHTSSIDQTFASRRLMKHDLKANRHTCLSIVADPKMTTWQGIASNLAFGLEGLHHELGSKFFKELSVMRYPITINCTI